MYFSHLDKRFAPPLYLLPNRLPNKYLYKRSNLPWESKSCTLAIQRCLIFNQKIQNEYFYCFFRIGMPSDISFGEYLRCYFQLGIMMLVVVLKS